MKKFVSVIASIIVVVAVFGYLLLFLSVSTFKLYIAPETNRCYLSDRGNGQYSLITFTPDNQMIQDRFLTGSKSDSAMTRSIFDISGSIYAHHLIGSLYFVDRGLFPFRIAQLDTVPIQAKIKAVDYKTYNSSSKNELAIGDTTHDTIYLSDDYLVIKGEQYVRIKQIPADLYYLMSMPLK